MKDENELEGFNTTQFGKYENNGLKSSTNCPSIDYVYSHPASSLDYISCHKFLIIIIIALIGFIFYTGTAQLKKATEGDEKSDK